MDWSIRRVNVHDSSCGVGKSSARTEADKTNTGPAAGSGRGICLYNAANRLLATETQPAASLHTNWKGSLGIESDRPADYCGVPGGDPGVRAAVSQAAANDAGLLSRRPQHSVVGDFAVDCGGGD